MSLANALLQLNVPDGYRGRAMGFFMMMFMGFIPAGNLIFGTLAYFFSAPSVVFFGSLLSLLFYVSISKKVMRYLLVSK